MKQVYFSTLKKYDSNYDLKNDIVYEIFSFACSIYTAIQKDKSVVVVDSGLFDLDYLTQSLKKYNIRVLEKDTLDYSLIAVFYGKGDKVLDITDKVPPFIQGSFNQMNGDPCPNELKELFIGYRLNGIEYTDTYSESYDEMVVFDAKHATYSHDYFWIDKVNLVVYEDILKNIKVKNTFHSNLSHVFHILSIEDIKPYAMALSKTPEECYDTLLNKYIEIMNLFILTNTEPILVLHKYGIPSKLENVLNKKGNLYKFLNITDKKTYEEVGGSNGIFVGNFNKETLTGSSCSYYLHTIIPSSKSILIDLANLYQID